MKFVLFSPEFDGTSFFSIGGMMGFDPDSGFPIEEQVCANSARGDFLASNCRNERKKTKERVRMSVHSVHTVHTMRHIKAHRTGRGGTVVSFCCEFFTLYSEKSD